MQLPTQMPLAHTLGAGGPDLELLILAAAMLILAVVFFMQRSVKPIMSLVLLLGSFGLVAGAFAAGGDDEAASAGPGSASISIAAPSDGAEVAAGEPLRLSVEVQGGVISSEENTDDPSVGHLHVFVDGALDSMPTSGTPEVILEPGEHEIVVEFTRADHRSYEPRILDRIEVLAR